MKNTKLDEQIAAATGFRLTLLKRLRALEDWVDQTTHRIQECEKTLESEKASRAVYMSEIDEIRVQLRRLDVRGVK